MEGSSQYFVHGPLPVHTTLEQPSPHGKLVHLNHLCLTAPKNDENVVSVVAKPIKVKAGRRRARANESCGVGGADADVRVGERVRGVQGAGAGAQPLRPLGARPRQPQPLQFHLLHLPLLQRPGCAPLGL
jgi:hypothetical protein